MGFIEKETGEAKLKTLHKDSVFFDCVNVLPIPGWLPRTL